MTDAAKIIIVDDDKNKLGLLLRLMRKHGYVVQYANNGEKAIEMVRELRPDLVLLDVMMPGMSGYEVCRTLRKDAENRFLKIIMVTGRASKEDCNEGMNSGADFYVKLPFDDNKLVDLVQSLLRLKTAQEQLDQNEGNDDE